MWYPVHPNRENNIAPALDYYNRHPMSYDTPSGEAPTPEPSPRLQSPQTMDQDALMTGTTDTPPSSYTVPAMGTSSTTTETQELEIAEPGDKPMDVNPADVPLPEDNDDDLDMEPEGDLNREVTTTTTTTEVATQPTPQPTPPPVNDSPLTVMSPTPPIDPTTFE